MNTDTGMIYDLGADIIGDRATGDKLQKAEMDAKLAKLDRSLTSDEIAAAVDLAKGDTIVRVSAAAAQRARIGDRELRRRRQRRR